MAIQICAKTSTASVFAAIMLAVAAGASTAKAACSDPAGEESVMVYNKNHDTMQFCDGSNWIDMGAAANDLSAVLGNGNDATGQDAVNFGKSESGRVHRAMS